MDTVLGAIHTVGIAYVYLEIIADRGCLHTCFVAIVPEITAISGPVVGKHGAAEVGQAQAYVPG